MFKLRYRIYERNGRFLAQHRPFLRWKNAPLYYTTNGEPVDPKRYPAWRVSFKEALNDLNSIRIKDGFAGIAYHEF